MTTPPPDRLRELEQYLKLLQVRRELAELKRLTEYENRPVLLRKQAGGT